MSDPIVDPSDLALYLNDEETINEPRAELMIRLAQQRCETVLYPLPDAAAATVLRVAHRAYVMTPSSRQYQLDQADSMYDGQAGALGGVYLTAADRAELMQYGPTTQAVYSVPLGAPWNTVDYTR